MNSHGEESNDNNFASQQYSELPWLHNLRRPCINSVIEGKTKEVERLLNEGFHQAVESHFKGFKFSEDPISEVEKEIQVFSKNWGFFVSYIYPNVFYQASTLEDLLRKNKTPNKNEIENIFLEAENETEQDFLRTEEGTFADFFLAKNKKYYNKNDESCEIDEENQKDILNQWFGEWSTKKTPAYIVELYLKVIEAKEKNEWKLLYSHLNKLQKNLLQICKIFVHGNQWRKIYFLVKLDENDLQKEKFKNSYVITPEYLFFINEKFEKNQLTVNDEHKNLFALILRNLKYNKSSFCLQEGDEILNGQIYYQKDFNPKIIKQESLEDEKLGGYIISNNGFFYITLEKEILSLLIEDQVLNSLLVKLSKAKEIPLQEQKLLDNEDWQMLWNIIAINKHYALSNNRLVNTCWKVIAANKEHSLAQLMQHSSYPELIAKKKNIAAHVRLGSYLQNVKERPENIASLSFNEIIIESSVQNMLHVAVLNNQWETVKALFKGIYSASINKPDKEGHTPFSLLYSRCSLPKKIGAKDHLIHLAHGLEIVNLAVESIQKLEKNLQDILIKKKEEKELIEQLEWIEKIQKEWSTFLLNTLEIKTSKEFLDKKNLLLANSSTMILKKEKPNKSKIPFVSKGEELDNSHLIPKKKQNTWFSMLISKSESDEMNSPGIAKTASELHISFTNELEHHFKLLKDELKEAECRKSWIGISMAFFPEELINLRDLKTKDPEKGTMKKNLKCNLQ